MIEVEGNWSVCKFVLIEFKLRSLTLDRAMKQVTINYSALNT